MDGVIMAIKLQLLGHPEVNKYMLIQNDTVDQQSHLTPSGPHRPLPGPQFPSAG